MKQSPGSLVCGSEVETNPQEDVIWAVDEYTVHPSYINKAMSGGRRLPTFNWVARHHRKNPMALVTTLSTGKGMGGLSVLLRCRGSRPTIRTLAITHEAPPHFLGRDRRIASLLARTPGALEIVLMLADVGATTSDRLVPEAVDEQYLLEAIGGLVGCGLVTVRGKVVSLTETGSLVVEKLRSPRESGGHD